MTSDHIPLNKTGFVGDNFIKENPVVAIPYLTF